VVRESQVFVGDAVPSPLVYQVVPLPVQLSYSALIVLFLPKGQHVPEEALEQVVRADALAYHHRGSPQLVAPSGFYLRLSPQDLEQVREEQERWIFVERPPRLLPMASSLGSRTPLWHPAYSEPAASRRSAGGRESPCYPRPPSTRAPPRPRLRFASASTASPSYCPGASERTCRNRSARDRSVRAHRAKEHRFVAATRCRR
jgi:hypothetical protein